MRKNFKLFTGAVAAAALMMGSVMPVMAANDGSATGEAEYEGFVEEVSAFTVVVPTSAAAADYFGFTVDPNGLLKDTDYTRLLGGDANVTGANFDANAKLYFENEKTEGGVTTDPWYTNTSKKLTCVNQSSYAVNVEVTAAVTGADGVDLAAITSSTEDPTLYLAIKTDETGKETNVIGDEGGTYSSTIDGVEDNFQVKYNSTASKYEYVTRTNTDPSKKYNKNGDEVTSGGESGVALDDWEDVDFWLEGDCGGEWTAEQSALEISVALTWKVTDPNASVTVTYMNGDTQFTTQSVTKGQTTTAPATDPTKEADDDYTYEFAEWCSDAQLTTAFDFDTAINEATTLYAKFTAVAKNVAPSIATTSYAAGTSAVDVNVNLGSGDLAATGIASITFEKNGATSTLSTAKYSFENGVLTFNADYVSGLTATRVHKITFNDDAATEVEVTLTK